MSPKTVQWFSYVKMKEAWGMPENVECCHLPGVFLTYQALEAYPLAGFLRLRKMIARNLCLSGSDLKQYINYVIKMKQELSVRQPGLDYLEILLV